jgi:hypothetical protein
MSALAVQHPRRADHAVATGTNLVVVTAVAMPTEDDLLAAVVQWARGFGVVDEAVQAVLRRRNGVVLLRVQIRTARSPARVGADLVAAFAPLLLSWRVQPLEQQRVLVLTGPDAHLLGGVLDLAEAGSLGGEVVAVAGEASARAAATTARWWSRPFVPVAKDIGRALGRIVELHLVDAVADLDSGLLVNLAVRDELERRGVPVIGLVRDGARVRVRYATGAAASDITAGDIDQAAPVLADAVRAHCAGLLVAAADGGMWWL